MEYPALMVFLAIIAAGFLVRKLGLSLIGLLLLFVFVAGSFPNDMLAQMMVGPVKALIPLLLVLFGLKIILFGKSK